MLICYLQAQGLPQTAPLRGATAKGWGENLSEARPLHGHCSRPIAQQLTLPPAFSVIIIFDKIQVCSPIGRGRAPMGQEGSVLPTSTPLPPLVSSSSLTEGREGRVWRKKENSRRKLIVKHLSCARIVLGCPVHHFTLFLQKIGIFISLFFS